MKLLSKFIFLIAAAMPLATLVSCGKDTPEIVNPDNNTDEPGNIGDPDDPDDPDNSDDPDNPDDTNDQEDPNFEMPTVKPTEYILSYQVDGMTYKMIRVDAPSDAPFRSFYMMETELPITKSVKFGSHYISALDNGDQIVIKSEMQKFMAELREKTNLPFRLPTKSEWFYAASGGAKGHGYTYAGGDVLDYVGWYKDNSGGKLNGLALKKPNELGFYDMSGNYAELCNEGSSEGSYVCNVDGPYCGGSYKDAAKDCTVKSWKEGSKSGTISGTRFKEQNAVDSRYIGFRFVYTIVDELESGNPEPDPNPGKYVTSYFIGSSQHKMILVDAPKGSSFKSFYMMEVELPINAVISFDKYNWIHNMDSNGDGIITKAEFSNLLMDVRSLTGLPFRLPTIDEWQFAASGGQKSKGYKYAGGNVLSQVGWYKDNCGGVAQPPAKKLPNELGFYDMSGNYAELCNETSDIYYVDGPYCGGSFQDADTGCTVTSWKDGTRTGNVPGTRLKEQNAVDTRYIGFRLVYTVDE